MPSDLHNLVKLTKLRKSEATYKSSGNSKMMSKTHLPTKFNVQFNQDMKFCLDRINRVILADIVTHLGGIGSLKRKKKRLLIDR